MPPPPRPILLSLFPALLILGLLLISTALGPFPFFHLTLHHTLIEVSSTSWRALEIAIVNNPVYVLGVEYNILPKPHNPVFGTYLGPVPIPFPSTCLLLVAPYYVLFLLALIWPATLLWRSHRRQLPHPGFPLSSSNSQQTKEAIGNH